MYYMPEFLEAHHISLQSPGLGRSGLQAPQFGQIRLCGPYPHPHLCDVGHGLIINSVEANNMTAVYDGETTAPVPQEGQCQQQD